MASDHDGEHPLRDLAKLIDTYIKDPQENIAFPCHRDRTRRPEKAEWASGGSERSLPRGWWPLPPWKVSSSAQLLLHLLDEEKRPDAGADLQQ